MLQGGDRARLTYENGEVRNATITGVHDRGDDVDVNFNCDQYPPRSPIVKVEKLGKVLAFANTVVLE